jgi:maltose alpha-D-glucosyltransferase/alpha-amylase
MRVNLGIRRRLAPLLENDRRRIELMNALLFSLPGTPVLYYGDEIGMGDNVFLGDRNGVRTPMQWSADRNAGFSRTNPQRLYLPVNIDPEYHYEAVNVETQQNNPHSLLWWTKRLIQQRKQFRAFGRGSLQFLYPSNRKVLAFIRQLEDERVLVIANLSRFAQCVDLDLASFQGSVPVEVFGRAKFPLITENPYLLSLGPHAFYWFHLQPNRAGGPGGRCLLRGHLTEAATYYSARIAHAPLVSGPAALHYRPVFAKRSCLAGNFRPSAVPECRVWRRRSRGLPGPDFRGHRGQVRGHPARPA